MNTGILSHIKKLCDRDAIFYVSHSGGKDSQAMYAMLSNLVPYDQIVVVHADLGEVEWDGIQEHIKSNIHHPLNIVKAVWKDGREKNLLDYVLHRFSVRPNVPSWPSAASRWCTSELKTGPIYKFIRRNMKARQATLAVNCLGIRSQESFARSKKSSFELNKELSKAGREVYNMLPIFTLTTEDIFRTIALSNQKPFWAYNASNERLSCVFCVLGSDNDLKNGLKYRPSLFFRYRELEKTVGYTMFHKKSISERVGLIPAVNV